MPHNRLLWTGSLRAPPVCRCRTFARPIDAPGSIGLRCHSCGASAHAPHLPLCSNSAECSSSHKQSCRSAFRPAQSEALDFAGEGGVRVAVSAYTARGNPRPTCCPCCGSRGALGKDALPNVSHVSDLNRFTIAGRRPGAGGQARGGIHEHSQRQEPVLPAAGAGGAGTRSARDCAVHVPHQGPRPGARAGKNLVFVRLRSSFVISARLLVARCWRRSRLTGGKRKEYKHQMTQHMENDCSTLCILPTRARFGYDFRTTASADTHPQQYPPDCLLRLAAPAVPSPARRPLGCGRLPQHMRCEIIASMADTPVWAGVMDQTLTRPQCFLPPLCRRTSCGRCGSITPIRLQWLSTRARLSMQCSCICFSASPGILVPDAGSVCRRRISCGRCGSWCKRPSAPTAPM